MSEPRLTRCLILACGNTLRGDDGVGPWLAEWAESRFRNEPSIRVISRQQWTPELSEDLAHASAAIFVDCSTASLPGSVDLIPVAPEESRAEPGSHHLGAAELMALGEGLFGSAPREALLLTVGAGSTGLGETFSEEVKAALPRAAALLEETVRRLVAGAESSLQR